MAKLDSMKGTTNDIFEIGIGDSKSAIRNNNKIVEIKKADDGTFVPISIQGHTHVFKIESWKQDTDYIVGQPIMYNNQFYICSSSHKSNTLFDSTEWIKSSGSGSSSGVSMELWSNLKNYNVDDLVINDSCIYQCINANLNSLPTNINSDWRKISSPSFEKLLDGCDFTGKANQILVVNGDENGITSTNTLVGIVAGDSQKLGGKLPSEYQKKIYIQSTFPPLASTNDLLIYTGETPNPWYRWNGSGWILVDKYTPPQLKAIQLSDLSNTTYTGNAGKAMCVKTTEDGVEFVALAKQSDFTTHSTNMNNPHQTNLSKVLLAGNTATTNINMNGYKITNIPNPTSNLDVANKSYVDTVSSSGIFPKALCNYYSIKNPTGYNFDDGIRFLLPSTGCLGSFAGHDGQIATWVQSLNAGAGGFSFEVPSKGWEVFVSENKTRYYYDGTSWLIRESATTHNYLEGLQGGNPAEGEFYHLDKGSYENLFITNINTTDKIQEGTNHLFYSDSKVETKIANSVTNTETVNMTYDTSTKKISSVVNIDNATIKKNSSGIYADKDTAQWNANKIKNIDVDDSGLADNTVLGYVSGKLEFVYPSGGVNDTDLTSTTTTLSAKKIGDVLATKPSISDTSTNTTTTWSGDKITYLLFVVYFHYCLHTIYLYL